MMGQLFGHREWNNVPVQMSFSVCECPEQGRDRVVEILHCALGCRGSVAVVPWIAHSHTVAALIPQCAEAEHAFLATRAVSVTWATLAKLLNEALAYVTSTKSFVAAQCWQDPSAAQQDSSCREQKVEWPHDLSPWSTWPTFNSLSLPGLALRAPPQWRALSLPPCLTPSQESHFLRAWSDPGGVFWGGSHNTSARMHIGSRTQQHRRAVRASLKRHSLHCALRVAKLTAHPSTPTSFNKL